MTLKALSPSDTSSESQDTFAPSQVMVLRERYGEITEALSIGNNMDLRLATLRAYSMWYHVCVAEMIHKLIDGHITTVATAVVYGQSTPEGEHMVPVYYILMF